MTDTNNLNKPDEVERGKRSDSATGSLMDTPETEKHLSECLQTGGRSSSDILGGNAYSLARKLERERNDARRLAKEFAERLRQICVSAGYNSTELWVIKQAREHPEIFTENESR